MSKLTEIWQRLPRLQILWPTPEKMLTRTGHAGETLHAGIETPRHGFSVSLRHQPAHADGSLPRRWILRVIVWRVTLIWRFYHGTAEKRQ